LVQSCEFEDNDQPPPILARLQRDLYTFSKRVQKRTMPEVKTSERIKEVKKTCADFINSTQERIDGLPLVKSTREQIGSFVTETVNNPAFNDRKQNLFEFTQKIKETGIEQTTVWFNWSWELSCKITGYISSYLGKNQVEEKSFESGQSQESYVYEQLQRDLNSDFPSVNQGDLFTEDDEQDKIDFNNQNEFSDGVDMEEEIFDQSREQQT